MGLLATVLACTRIKLFNQFIAKYNLMLRAVGVAAAIRVVDVVITDSI